MPEPDRKQVLTDEVHVSGRPGPGGRLRCVLLFPNEYAVAMPNLGFQTLYRLLNSHPEITCERAFWPPVPDAGARFKTYSRAGFQPANAVLDGYGTPSSARSRPGRLRSLETATPLAGFDVVGISSSFELDWLRIPPALEAGGVPPLAAERTERDPLVLIGGPAVTGNPEPIAELADALFIGEIEGVFPDLAETLLATRGGQSSRLGGMTVPASLDALGSIPGCYVPSRPLDGAVHRAVAADLETCETRSEIITPHAEFPRSFLIEVGRGCPRGCRFCLARQIYQPFRTRSLDALTATARLGREFTDQFGLVGAAVADHPDLASLANAIVAMGGRVSTSSLRAERVTPELVDSLAASGQRSITLAPETADERLAERIGKQISREAIHAAIRAAVEVGIVGIKLYFMVGLPGETDAEAVGIADYVAELQDEFPRARFTVSVDQLIPKAHTELARIAVPEPGAMRARLRAVGRALKAGTRARARLGSARWAAVQVVLSRGGRELTPVLLDAAHRGGGAAEFIAALRAEGLRLDDYLGPQHGDAPWEVVDLCPTSAGEARDG